jgi:hypothetical protein
MYFNDRVYLEWLKSKGMRPGPDQGTILDDQGNLFMKEDILEDFYAEMPNQKPKYGPDDPRLWEEHWKELQEIQRLETEEWIERHRPKSVDEILSQFGYDQYDNRFQSAYEDYWKSPNTDKRGLMDPAAMKLYMLGRQKQQSNSPMTVTSLTTPTGGGDSLMMQRQDRFGGGGMPRGPYEPGMPVDPNMGRISVSNTSPDPQDRWGMGSNDRWSGIQNPQQPQQTLPAMDPNDRYGQTQPKKRTFVGTF